LEEKEEKKKKGMTMEEAAAAALAKLKEALPKIAPHLREEFAKALEGHKSTGRQLSSKKSKGV
jgi:hypothetical protein